MTARDELFEMLDRLNPVPDPDALYRDRGDAARLRAAVELRMGHTASVPRLRPTAHVGFAPARRGWLVAAAAFAVVLLLGAAGLLLTRPGTGDLGPTAAGTVPPTSAPPLVAESTTTHTPATTTGPPTTATVESTTPTTTTTTTPATTTTPPATTTTPLPTTSMLGSSEPAPPGVDPEVPWLMGDGPGLCEDFWDYAGPPTIQPDLVGYTGGQGPFFCVLGFDTGVPVELTVTAYGMPAKSYTLDPALDLVEGPGFAFVWRSFPDDPLGEHMVQATQGSQTASIVFEVVPPTSSGVIVEPRRASAGEPIDVFLFGHEPNSDVTVHVYHQSEAKVNAVYVTSSVVAIGADGWGTLHIDTGTSDPPGIYQFITDPASDMWVWAVSPYAQSVLELGP